MSGVHQPQIEKRPIVPHASRTQPIWRKNEVPATKMFDIVREIKICWWKILLRGLITFWHLSLTQLIIASLIVGKFAGVWWMLAMLVLSIAACIYDQYKCTLLSENKNAYKMSPVKVITYDHALDKIIEIKIPPRKLVPDDLIRLEPGDIIPAELAIEESHDFHVLAKSPNKRNTNQEDFVLMKFDAESGAIDIPLLPTISKTTRLRKFFYRLFGKNGGPFKAHTSKDIEAQVPEHSTVLMGSVTVTGAALGRVYTAEEDTTKFGKVLGEMKNVKRRNKFRRELRRFTISSFLFGIALLGCVVLLQCLLQNISLKDALISAIPIVFVLIPTFVPSMVSMTLCQVTGEMKRSNLVGNDIEAVLRLGGIDVLCIGRSKNLTMDYLSVKSTLNKFGNPSPATLFIGHLHAYFRSHKHRRDRAIISNYSKKVPPKSLSNPVHSPENSTGQTIRRVVPPIDLMKKLKLVKELPFDYERRRVSVILEEADQQGANYIFICKGSVPEILNICTSEMTAVGVVKLPETNMNFLYYTIIKSRNRTDPIGPVERELLRQQALEFNKEGDEEVMAVAYKKISKGEQTTFSYADENDLTFVGFIVFTDPYKHPVRPNIMKLEEKQVNVRLLTGTCAKPPSFIKRIEDMTIEGPDLAIASPENLSSLVAHSKFFIKLSPKQKAEIVKTLQKHGYRVGYLGDGPSDIPALSLADVSISTEQSPPACMEIADVIIPYEKFDSILKLVTLGRKTHANIMKYTIASVSASLSVILSILGLSIWLPFPPVEAVQLYLLKITFIMRQLPILWDRVDPKYLKKPREWNSCKIWLFVLMICFLSSGFIQLMVAFIFWSFSSSSSWDNWNEDDVKLIQTGFFFVSLLTHVVMPHMIRTWKVVPTFKSYCEVFRAGIFVFLTAALSLVVAFVFPYFHHTTLPELVGMAPLPLEFHFVFWPCLIFFCWVVQFVKTSLKTNYNLSY